MHHALPTGPRPLPPAALWLGFAGLAPQLMLAVVAIAGPARFASAARDAGVAYSGIILSFIGGAWWGLASRAHANVHWSNWIAAVTPSLIAFAAIGAMAIGQPRGQSLWLTGTSLIATLGIDRRLAANGLTPPGWLGLRVSLSLGLAGLTILMAILS